MILGIRMTVGTVNGLNMTNNEKNLQTKNNDQWTGTIRIEGETNTIWEGTITLESSDITAKNTSTGFNQTYHIPYPSVLGTLEEASKTGGFTYTVEYWPAYNSFLVMQIENDANSFTPNRGWSYWVDYEYYYIGANDYELTTDDNEILWGYVHYNDNWTNNVNLLKIDIDNNEVRKNKEVTVKIYNQTMQTVENTVIYINGEISDYTTDENGEAVIKISTIGAHNIHAEKEETSDDSYIRSDKTTLTVKRFRFRSFEILSLFPFLKNLQNFFLFFTH